jgi:rhodanese-related sulfurtransferase
VEVLAEESAQSVANTSQHLQVLRGSRLVEAEKHGLYVEYRLAGPEVCEFFLSMRILAESRLTDIDAITRAFLEERESMEAVDQDALIRRVREGSVTVLDVRPTEEFEAGHIPGAKSVPLEELLSHLARLPKRREIVAYCRGPYCVLAVEAVRILREKGFRAVRLEDGIPDWRARGLPIEDNIDSNL